MKKVLVFLMFVALFYSCSDDKPTLPKTLLFSAITPEYLQDNAAEWKATGFNGFLFSYIMSNWSDDIWATDGDSSTRGEDDLTFQRVKSCNDVCREHGITENFVKVAFYDHVPLWTDDTAWEKFHQNFREAARFAKMSGCRGIALDIEYVSEQYDLDWEGYDYKGYTETDLREAAGRRGREMVQAMLQVYPNMVFLNLPEGISYYGQLATDLFIGMVQGMANANAPGGLHLLTELSYDITSTLGLVHYGQRLESTILRVLEESTTKYWKKKCTIALGGWPLGYYRKILDENGVFLGYGGRQDKFGDKIIGSYADKSGRFSVERFRNQYAGLLLGCKRYCWIYAHGAAWWHFTDEDVAKYGNVSNSTVPVDEKLDEYKAVVREKWTSTEKMEKLNQLVKQHKTDEFLQALGFINTFKVIGPFGCKECNNFDTSFPPEKETDLNAEYQGSISQVQWQTCSVDAESGYLDLLNYLDPSDWVCAYVYCRVISPKTASAQIRLGTNDTGTLWFNGKKILSKNVERVATPDTDILPVELKEGENIILIKVCNTEVNWGVYLRISDESGEPIKNLEYWP